MKTINLKKPLTYFFALLFLIACQTESVEDNIIELEQQNHTLDNLPEHIKQKVNVAQQDFIKMGKEFNATKKEVLDNISSSSKQEESSFGFVDPSMATHSVDRVGQDTYALAMEKGNDPRAIDNMVIVDRGDGETAAFIIRHMPTDNWYSENPTAEDFGKAFSGSIQIFNAEQGLIATTELDNGELVINSDNTNNPTNAKAIGGIQNNISKSSSSTTCFITNVEYAGLLQNGIFYITNIDITVDCVSSGGSGGGDPFGGGFDGNSEGGGSGGGGGIGGTSTSVLDFEHLVPSCPEGFVNAPVGNGCVLEDALVPNPCKQMEEAQTDTNLKSKLSELKGKVNDNKEFGRLITGTKPTTFSSFLIGQPNQAGINFVANSKIDGLIHSHYNGLLPVFSGSDLKAIYELYKGDKIRKWKTFTAYLVTGGTTYALKIENINDFIAYGDAWFTTDDLFDSFENVYNFNIKIDNSNTENELAFADFIKGSGLKLFKGNPITFNTWTPITSNSAQTGIINDNCN